MIYAEKSLSKLSLEKDDSEQVGNLGKDDTEQAANHEVDHSTFSKIYCIYSRNGLQLNGVENKNGFNLLKYWNEILKNLTGETKNGEVIARIVNVKDQVEDVKVFEYKHPNENQVRGVILKSYEDEANNELKDFHDWFSRLVVSDTRISFSSIEPKFDSNAEIAAEVAQFFANNLKNTTNHDEWESKGMQYFIKRVEYFTTRNLRIEAVLPAFPCKSSNTEKVYGLYPDKGEELALRRLIYVCNKIKKVYLPGLKIFIVSDGHVFSDCIGVDDDIVDNYTVKLRELYYQINKSADEDVIGFVSLKDLFFNKDEEFNQEMISNVLLDHFTGTKICPEAELSRRLLMAGCDTDAGKLRRDVNELNHPRLHLYRGFTRFMLEDLTLHPFSKKISKKCFKKTVSKVAFEMIKRNDAYSNLVELLFPHHMRLSIHAHTNSGPKFGIRLISGEECKIIKALDSNAEPSFEDLLHIPTPWHNAIVQIEGDSMYYLTKSKIVTDAIEQGHYKGKWIETDLTTGQGGFFLISKV